MSDLCDTCGRVVPDVKISHTEEGNTVCHDCLPPESAPPPEPLNEAARIAVARLAIHGGVTLADFVRALNQVNPPSARDKRIIAAAREKVDDGVLEVDEWTLVSGTDLSGDYVLAWVWAEDPEHDD